MLRIPKENIKAFVTIVGGVVILVAFSVLIDVKFIHTSVFKKQEPDLTQYTNTAESKFEENKYEIVSEERRMLYYIDEIMDMINNKELEKLYNILDEEYRRLYVKSVDELEKNLSRFNNGEYSASYNGYFKEGNMYLINVMFNKATVTKEDILSSNATPIDTICIKENSKGDYRIAFNGFIMNKIINKEKSNDFIKVNVKNMLIKSDSTEVLLTIENLTNEKLKLYDDRLDIYLTHNGVFKYVNSNTISKNLEPRGLMVYKLSFKNVYSNDGCPKELVFNRITGSDGIIKKLAIEL